jgi:SAM-dependent methyltransferase
VISKSHKNRKHHNWLTYNIGDRFKEKHKDLYNGVLYDLGCGEKPYQEFFEQFVDKYIGVDWSGTLHDLKADIVADLNKPLPIDSESADTVVSFSVMEHLCEPQTMLNEAYRILKPGGNIILTVPFQWWVHEEPYDYFRYTCHGLEYMLKKAGFTEIKIEPTAGFFSMLCLKVNYFTRNLIRGPKFLRFMIEGALIPFWYLTQTIAPCLDKCHKNWHLETSGYWVVAKK